MGGAAMKAETLVCMASHNAASSRRCRGSRQAPVPASIRPGPVMLMGRGPARLEGQPGWRRWGVCDGLRAALGCQCCCN